MVTFSKLVLNAQADAVAKLLDDGFLRIYAGETLLAELRFGSPAYRLAKNGAAEADAIKGDPSAKATGKADRFRCFQVDGTTFVLEGSVGTSGADLNLSTASIQEGGSVDVTGFTLRLPA